MASKIPTLADVARNAGVHSSTVSRVMNPATRGMVSGAVAKRILAAASEIGYRPNRAAATLRTRRSEVIGVVIPDITNAVFPPILMGIEEGLRQHGYLALVANVGNDAEEQRFGVDRLLGQQVDGLIFATASRHDPLIERCVADGVAVVAVNRSDESGIASCVVNDESCGVRLAVEHLAALGHTRIVHIAGPEHLSTGNLRRLGFLAALQACRIEPYGAVASSTYSRAAGKKALLEVLRLAPGTTAIVAGNDLIALGCYDALKESGLACPGDVSIVGHNDMPLMDMLWPPMTTVRIRHHEMGLEAARMVLQRINSPHSAVLEIRLKPELVVRGSTTAPRSANMRESG